MILSKHYESLVKDMPDHTRISLVLVMVLAVTVVVAFSLGMAAEAWTVVNAYMAESATIYAMLAEQFGTQDKAITSVVQVMLASLLGMNVLAALVLAEVRKNRKLRNETGFKVAFKKVSRRMTGLFAIVFYVELFVLTAAMNMDDRMHMPRWVLMFSFAFMAFLATFFAGLVNVLRFDPWTQQHKFSGSMPSVLTLLLGVNFSVAPWATYQGLDTTTVALYVGLIFATIFLEPIGQAKRLQL